MAKQQLYSNFASDLFNYSGCKCMRSEIRRDWQQTYCMHSVVHALMFYTYIGRHKKLPFSFRPVQ